MTAAAGQPPPPSSFSTPLDGCSTSLALFFNKLMTKCSRRAVHSPTSLSAPSPSSSRYPGRFECVERRLQPSGPAFGHNTRAHIMPTIHTAPGRGATCLVFRRRKRNRFRPLVYVVAKALLRSQRARSSTRLTLTRYFNNQGGGGMRAWDRAIAFWPIFRRSDPSHASTDS